jgi:ABC-2 type transport system ATP-binding protein
VIVASHLSRRFGTRAVVDDVSFDVGRAEIVALLGPNGAGKTTTLRMLAGLIAPTRGSVVIDGVELTPATGTTLRGRIGFLTEAPGLWDRLTVRENLIVYAGLYALDHPDRAVDRVLEVLELGDRTSSRAAELSKGARQKVALARALLHDPAILLLDEPTSGLDPEIARAVRRLLDQRRAAGCAILLSTHNLDEAERLADRVAVLQGRLLAIDRPGALRRRLTIGRVAVRVAGDASAYIATAATFDPAASAEGPRLLLTTARPDHDVPALIRALVAAGADIVEVRPEIPALEDVYLNLVGDGPTRHGDAG